MTTDAEALRAKFEWDFQIFEPSRNDVGDYTDRVVRVAWIAYQQGYAAAKAETAAAVAKEMERAATVVDEKIGSVCKANPGRGGRINSAAAFALGALRDCAAAIRAGAKSNG